MSHAYCLFVLFYVIKSFNWFCVSQSVCSKQRYSRTSSNRSMLEFMNPYIPALVLLYYPVNMLNLDALTHVQVSVKELWNILCEMKLRGTLTKNQFEKCVKYVLIDETGKDDDMVSTYLFFIYCTYQSVNNMVRNDLQAKHTN